MQKSAEQEPTGSRGVGDGPFATTQWSLVVAAGRGQAVDARRALSSLCDSYWRPLYAYVRRRVADPHEAQDLTQAFFAELLEKDYLRSATPDRGRFRAFLLSAFKHFLAKQWRKGRAQKRGGGRTIFSLDFETADVHCRREPSSGRLSPEELYERQWTITLLEHVMQRLAGESARAGKQQQFDELKGFLVGDHAGRTYADAAERLNMTEAAAKMAAHRLRARYRELLREGIAATVASPEEVDDEIRQLFATLGG